MADRVRRKSSSLVSPKVSSSPTSPPCKRRRSSKEVGGVESKTELPQTMSPPVRRRPPKQSVEQPKKAAQSNGAIDKKKAPPPMSTVDAVVESVLAATDTPTESNDANDSCTSDTWTLAERHFLLEALKKYGTSNLTLVAIKLKTKKKHQIQEYLASLRERSDYKSALADLHHQRSVVVGETISEKLLRLVSEQLMPTTASTELPVKNSQQWLNVLSLIQLKQGKDDDCSVDTFQAALHSYANATRRKIGMLEYSRPGMKVAEKLEYHRLYSWLASAVTNTSPPALRKFENAVLSELMAELTKKTAGPEFDVYRRIVTEAGNQLLNGSGVEQKLASTSFGDGDYCADMSSLNPLCLSKSVLNFESHGTDNN